LKSKIHLEKQNTRLISKWLFQLINGEGAWQELLRNKYLIDKSITQVKKQPGDSQFWTSLMNAKDQFLTFRNFRLQSGNQIRFWEDKWIGASTLREQYPNLYNLVWKISATVQSIFSTIPLNISFRRSLVGANLQA
jgi:hypothetical protein